MSGYFFYSKPKSKPKPKHKPKPKLKKLNPKSS